MPRLKLEIDTLTVESFPIPNDEPQGTLPGAYATLTSCGGNPRCTCPPPL